MVENAVDFERIRVVGSNHAITTRSNKANTTPMKEEIYYRMWAMCKTCLSVNYLTERVFV